MRDGVGIFDLVALDGSGLRHVFDSLLTGTVDSVEVDDDIAGVVDEVVQNSVEARGSVGNDYDGGDGGVDIPRQCLPRFVQFSGIVVTDEAIRPRFGFLLVLLDERS